MTDWKSNLGYITVSHLIKQRRSRKAEKPAFGIGSTAKNVLDQGDVIAKRMSHHERLCNSVAKSILSGPQTTLHSRNPRKIVKLLGKLP